MARRNARPDRSICVACGVCRVQCPRKAISIYKGCFATVESGKCVGCGLCHSVCPANAISMTEITVEVADEN